MQGDIEAEKTIEQVVMAERKWLAGWLKKKHTQAYEDMWLEDTIAALLCGERPR